MEWWYTNDPYTAELLVTGSEGEPVSGLGIQYNVTKLPNTAIASGDLTDIGSGIYQTTILFTEEGQYRILYTPPISYPTSMEHIKVISKASQLTLQKFLSLK